MTEKAKFCVESCRDWYQAFVNCGKGEERSVKELLTTADLIESLSAQLEQVARERDAALRHIKRGYRACSACRYGDDTPGNNEVCGECRLSSEGYSEWKWGGVEM